MAKGRQTPMKRETSAVKRKARVDRYIRYGLIGMAIVVLGTLLAGVYVVLVARPNAPIAVVAGRAISTRDYQTLVRYARLNIRSQLDAVQAQLATLDPNDENSALMRQYLEQQAQQIQSAAAALPNQALEDIISDELIRQEAARRGLTASQEEIEKEAETFFGYDPNPPTPTPEPDLTATAAAAPTADTTATAAAEALITPTIEPAAEATPTSVGTPEPTPTLGPTPTPLPTPTPMTAEGYQALREQYLGTVTRQTGLSEAAFLRLMETRVLRGKLQEALAAEVPTTAPQVHVREITVTTPEDMDKVLARLDAGEDFAAVAAGVSVSPSKDKGGDIGWISEWSTFLDQPVILRVLEMNPGERDTASAYLGTQVFEVVEKEADRPLDEDMLKQRRGLAFTDWLDAAQQSDTVKRYWSSDKVPLDS